MLAKFVVGEKSGVLFCFVFPLVLHTGHPTQPIDHINESTRVLNMSASEYRDYIFTQVHPQNPLYSL